MQLPVPRPTLARPARDLLVTALLDALAVVLPVECAGCGRPDRSACARCRREIAVTAATVAALPDGTPLAWSLEYAGVARSVLLQLKAHGRTDSAGALVPALTASLGAALGVACGAVDGSGAERAEQPLLVPVPTSRRAFRRRGFDPVVLLCRRAGVRPTRALAFARAGADQKELGVAERARNRAGSMRVTRPLAGRRVVLVDDVATTGTTLLEAARVVRDAGGDVCAAAVVAFTERRFPPADDSFRFPSDISDGRGYGGAKGA